ncbi:Putative NAD(P)H nitroreductase acg [Mycolicibacterium vanbaalenii]|uniref:NAD(P)H nitroreductase acg n=1 Tax=Mycolicibacterium vanbaalenii TaxID=110539 RepID=A0A5S9NZF0_MYCVN|nr:NAD(P)H nitroreductase [Mycolicibacterium vanbaalenii]CAA0096298.1 Putative NAD(P)H nitroreductase acg [Mycolicibacterium vanbaalenii]
MPAIQPRCEVIVDALQLACRAPSLHNSQPWRWVATDDTVELFADPARLVRSADTTGREALISCGAVLDHFRVAMAASGWRAAVQRFPDPADPLHLATITFTAAAVSDLQRRRADAILLRRSDRLPLTAPPGWEDLASSFRQHTTSGGIRVDVVADEFRNSVAEASDLVEALRVYDAEYHSELSWWTAGFVSHEGIPQSSLISAAESDRVDVGRTFPVVAQAERRTEVDHDQSKILAISTEEDSSHSVLHCGEVLSAVLLDAAAAGLSTCTFSHITEVPTGRDIIAALIPGDAIPQTLVRVGLAPALDATPPPTPRRPVDEVLQLHRGRE